VGVDLGHTPEADNTFCENMLFYFYHGFKNDIGILFCILCLQVSRSVQYEIEGKSGTAGWASHRHFANGLDRQLWFNPIPLPAGSGIGLNHSCLSNSLANIPLRCHGDISSTFLINSGQRAKLFSQVR